MTGHIYDSNGLMSSESKDGVNIPHTIALDQWNIGGVVYSIDTLGRVIKKDNRIFTYGENGRISNVSGANVNQADYFYDEENNPILKVYKFGKIEVYLGDNAYVNDSFYEPIKVGSRMVGYFKNGIFVNSSQDHLNSNVVDETGAVNLATAYGERTTPRTEVDEVMDFTLKGFDADLDAVRMGHRYYDPHAKMFYTPDNFFLESPEKILKSPVEGNLYSYAGNEPVRNSDPSGDGLLGLITGVAGGIFWDQVLNPEKLGNDLKQANSDTAKNVSNYVSNKQTSPNVNFSEENTNVLKDSAKSVAVSTTVAAYDVATNSGKKLMSLAENAGHVLSIVELADQSNFTSKDDVKNFQKNLQVEQLMNKGSSSEAVVKEFTGESK